MKKLTTIDRFSDGAKIQGFFLCVEKRIRESRTHELYIDCLLRDMTGQVPAKIWEKVDHFDSKFDQGDPVAVSGRVESYQNHLQLIIQKINRASVQYYGRYGYDPALIVPASPYDPGDLWRTAVAHIKKIKNQYLRTLVSKLYRQNKDRILVHPGSLTMHHNYRSGFLEHTVSMVRLGQTLAQHYQVDTDLFMAGIFLHDIGKLREIQPGFDLEYTDEGHFIGHIVLGRDIILETAAGIKDFPKELLRQLEHLILAHQGRYEWQSPVTPKLKEALLLHYLDNMDAKMNLFNKALAEDKETGDWTDRRNYFRSNLFKK
ncbi:MAG: 3'-5' exoribonuclease YhaM family protein [Fidelibacterota bacterium]